MTQQRAQNVGICALEVYYPQTVVDQNALETFDGVSAGKYTIGLGQTNMAFCLDREDINSICMTVVDSLMTKYNISYADIGRLEVGTETIIDKSKSVKTCLMQLFEKSGNTDVEGIDTTNACYGGTSALFNSVAWMESSAWDGRFALVVCGDIAVYASGAARPTGGAGVVAMLIGPNAPLVIDAGLRASHFEHAWDFYKPDLSSEYPVVDGKLSITCYLRAVDICYTRYAQKFSRRTNQPFSMETPDFFCFHSPFTKLVKKSFGRILFNDFLTNPDDSKFANVQEFRDKKREETYMDRDVEKAFMTASNALCKQKVDPTLTLAMELGNTYTGSLYCGLASLLGNKTGAELNGKRAMLFSYGSGLASSMFSLTFSQPDHPIYAHSKAILDRLATRKWSDPADFAAAMKLREETHHLAPYTPVAPVEFFPGTYYLESIDDKHRRFYKRA
eukprot:comp11463_c0_seq1/m.5898 comp11463_c0_seq1/g.5898  ORF comp11463_c0_seq1/g.5898 comp11463_c0_seq1/m.5898 type:complete len:447 (-) comp11463_c0_seq1:657-1997(-)